VQSRPPRFLVHAQARPPLPCVPRHAPGYQTLMPDMLHPFPALAPCQATSAGCGTASSQWMLPTWSPPHQTAQRGSGELCYDLGHSKLLSRGAGAADSKAQQSCPSMLGCACTLLMLNARDDQAAMRTTTLSLQYPLCAGT